MSLLEELRKKHEILKVAGEGVRAEARSKGATFSYIDPENPDVIVIESADGEAHIHPSDSRRRARK